MWFLLQNYVIESIKKTLSFLVLFSQKYILFILKPFGFNILFFQVIQFLFFPVNLSLGVLFFNLCICKSLYSHMSAYKSNLFVTRFPHVYTKNYYILFYSILSFFSLFVCLFAYDSLLPKEITLANPSAFITFYLYSLLQFAKTKSFKK